MPTSVRLDPKTERVVRSLARRTGRTKSQVIRDAIHRLAASEAEAGHTRRLASRSDRKCSPVRSERPGGPSSAHPMASRHISKTVCPSPMRDW
jgi:hypothetical protein